MSYNDTVDDHAKNSRNTERTHIEDQMLRESAALLNDPHDRAEIEEIRAAMGAETSPQ